MPCPSELKTEEILENSGLLLKYTVYKNLGDISYGEEDYEKALDNYLEVFSSLFSNLYFNEIMQHCYVLLKISQYFQLYILFISEKKRN